ncbi:hypothetical protein [Oceanisphaera arctica]|nr:hypothetical protein [Oceanisphaera arctica]GHA21774.1 hypothetical protein GCM10007082_23220 [Oceanisphaera arctica]
MAAEAFTQWLARHKGLGWILLVVVVVLFWLWRGELYQAQVEEPAAEPVSVAEEFHVEVMTFDSEPYQPGVLLQGQLLPHRSLVLRTQASGTLTKLPRLGKMVSEGDSLLTLSDDGRTVKLARAEAEYRLRQAEVTAAVRLRRSQMISETSYLALKSAAAMAEAGLAEARLALNHTRIGAPFAGSVDALPARPAYRLSPALLALDDNGRPGVHIVDEQGRMQRVPVTLLSITPDEAWVSGLPQPVRIITRGAGFVTEGSTVRVREVEPEP